MSYTSHVDLPSCHFCVEQACRLIDISILGTFATYYLFSVSSPNEQYLAFLIT